MIIDNIKIDSDLLLAPMSGVSDYPYREIVKRFKPALVFSEMIASRALVENNKKTQKMIKKVRKINKLPSGVLIKFPKKKQDIRVDLPTIGLETIKQCKNAGLKGIVLKNRLNIFLNKTQSIKYANKNKMFILVK